MYNEPFQAQPGPVAQSVVSLIADPGVMSSIPVRPHTFMEIDHEIFSTVILLLPLNQEGLVLVTSESMCTKLTTLSKPAQKKVWLG